MINAYHPGNSEEIKMDNSFFGLSLVEENSHCRMKRRRVGLFWAMAVAALFLSGGEFCGGAAAAEPFRIQLVDQENQWPVPLMQLKTVDNVSYVTDNAGVIAFNEPDLMGKEVWFDISGHGYGVPADGFGYRGVRLKPVPGEIAIVKVERQMIAQRVGRLTGSGLLAESQKCGLYPEWRDTGVLGCDSVQTALYQGKVFWAWGDTSLANYPLGIFHTSAAVTELPTYEKPFLAQPPLMPHFELFRDGEGKPCGVAPMPGEGPTWLSGMLTLKDAQGNEKLCAVYNKIKEFLTPYEKGLCVWSDEKKQFERVRVIWERSSEQPMRLFPEGHPVYWKDKKGKDWILFGDPLPRLKCPASYEAWLDTDSWEKIESPMALPDAENPEQQVRLHSGSMQWSGYLKRWVGIFVQNGGNPSELGEVWYTEAESPFGPWSPAIKILTHQRYTFYNPRLHPELVPADSPYLLFEGTYSKQFSSEPVATPRWDYNQVLYRLDLEDVKSKRSKE